MVPLLDTRGAYPSFHIKFDSKVKYTKYLTSCKIPARELAGFYDNSQKTEDERR